MKPYPEGTRIVSRDGKLEGAATGSTHACTLHGCRGVRITVRWPDGTISHPCSKGLLPAPDSGGALKIG